MANTVSGLAIWAGKQLGITGPVTAELYKMLLYEKDAPFKPHTDTEKILGMFEVSKVRKLPPPQSR